VGLRTRISEIVRAKTLERLLHRVHRMSNLSFPPDPELRMLLHGWDSSGGFWHGPTEIDAASKHAAAIAQKLPPSHDSYHGKLRCAVRGCPAMEFQTAVYDLTDSGLAIVHSVAAPRRAVGAVVVIPAQRRPRIREEFAFGFVSFLSFLGGLASPEFDLEIHEYVEEVLRTAPSRYSLGFAVESANADHEAGVALSTCLERLSVGMLCWLSSKEEAGEEETPAVLTGCDGAAA
jgi:hypothetical protein